MEADVRVEQVDRSQTRTGKTRWVLRDERGTEYTTFRPPIGEAAERHRGRRARIEYHEEDRNGFHNVYLDGIEALGDGDDQQAPAPADAGPDPDPDEVAWNTAVEAAPWLLGRAAPENALSAEELYERLEPFKRRVAEDIRSEPEDRPERQGP
jgi:hypothetical protein